MYPGLQQSEHQIWTTKLTCGMYNNDGIMSAMASQITSLTIVYSTLYSGVDQRKHQSSASLAFVRRIHRWPVNSPHKGPITRKMFAFDDVIRWIHWPMVYRPRVSVMIKAFPCHDVIMAHIITHLPWKKWPSFRRRHFQIHFYEWKKNVLIKIFNEGCSWACN